MAELNPKVFAGAASACRLKAEQLEQTVRAARRFLKDGVETFISAIFSQLGETELQDDITQAKIRRNLPQLDQALDLFVDADRHLHALRERRLTLNDNRERLDVAVREAPACVSSLRAIADEIEECSVGSAALRAAPAGQPVVADRAAIDDAIAGCLRRAGVRNQMVIKAAKVAWGADPDRGVEPSDGTLNAADRKAIERAMRKAGGRPAVFKTCQSSPALLLALTDDFVAFVRREVGLPPA